MVYDAVLLFQKEQAFRASQNGAAVRGKGHHDQTSPSLEMIVGPWYCDEVGNPTREIKARD